MCRFYACRSGAGIDASRALLEAPHALVKQSCRDFSGEAHTDGWGIGCYPDSGPLLQRGTAPAAEDPAFTSAARRAHGRTVVAHVRAASVGTLSLANTHPFTHGRWLFAHNGTVTAFDVVGPLLERETEPSLQACRRGTTDSELVFLWLLSRMARVGLGDDGTPDAGRLSEVLGAAVGELAGRSEAAGAPEPAGLNLLLTEGNVLVASRWGRSLSWLAEPDRVHIASEPPWPAAWQEVPDRCVLAIDAALRVSVTPVSGRPAAGAAG